MEDRIVGGKELAIRDGFTSHRDWILAKSIELFNKKQLSKPWAGVVSTSTALAKIDFGRWLATCPACGGSEYVDPDEKLFFCFACGNKWAGGQALTVVFPRNKADIEKALLDRPVVVPETDDPLNRAMMSSPELPRLGRSWNPDETVKVLRKQLDGAKAQAKKGAV